MVAAPYGNWATTSIERDTPLSLVVPRGRRSSIGWEVAHRRISETRPLNIFITTADAAEQGDGEIIAVEDSMDVRGMRTSGGSPLFPESRANTDCDVIARARARGCVVIGKTNLSEWASDPAGINMRYGTVFSPRHADCLAGGPAGGAAAAVAAGTCDWAVGTDPDGSAATSASLCGVVAFRPTRGVLGLAGIMPRSQSLDAACVFAPDVRTAARAVDTLAGSDVTASAFLPEETERSTSSSFRLATPATWASRLDDDVARLWQRVRADVPEVAFPSLHLMNGVADRITRVEMLANHSTLLGEFSHYYDSQVVARLRTGARISAVDYVAALRQLRNFQSQVDDAMTGLDAVLLPATARSVLPATDIDAVRNSLTLLSLPLSLTGNPVVVLAVPAPGAVGTVGVQIVGRAGRDADLVRVAAALEDRWCGNAALIRGEDAQL